MGASRFWLKVNTDEERKCVPQIITKTRPCNILHYFTAVKNDDFQMKNCNMFLIFAQNIDFGYTLEPPQ